MKSIRAKILLCMTMTVSVSLILVGSVSIWLNYNSTNETLEQTMCETVRISAERVSQELIAYLNVAQDAGAIARLGNPEVSISEKRSIIEQRAKDHGFVRGNLLSANGISQFDGNNYTDREYFQKAMQGNPYVSQPLISKITGELSIMVAAPLWQDGLPGTKVIGVVYFVPPESFLNDIVSSIQVSENGSAYMLNANGTVIAHKNIDNVKNQENTLEDVKSDPSLAPIADLDKRMTLGESGFGEYSYGGVDKILAFAPVPETDGWSLGINAPKDDFMGATYLGLIITAVLLVLSCFVSFLIALRLANGIGNPIRICSQRLEQLAKGDLTSPVPQVKYRDETGKLAEVTKTIADAFRGIISDIDYGLDEMANGNFNVNSKMAELYVGDFQQISASMYRIMDRLSTTLYQVKVAADQVASGSNQVSSGAQALSQGATEQASSVEELAATINEISVQVQRNAAGAKDASQKADEVGQEMKVSNERMRQMIKAMDEISGSSSEIGKIIKTIEDIAFQTNILALNAAVEAARAGAAGKGFAVVADEVRNLASKSSEASKNTAALIEGSIRAVENGTHIADATAESLAIAVTKASEVVKVIDQISGASVEQANSIAQVTQGVDQISAVVQTNSATAEESAAASEELSSQAQVLKGLVERFQLRGHDAVKAAIAEEHAEPIIKLGKNADKY